MIRIGPRWHGLGAGWPAVSHQR